MSSQTRPTQLSPRFEKRWPYRPRPEVDESAFGYAARVAHGYGFGSVWQLADLFLPGPATQFRASSQKARGFLDGLAEVMEIPSDARVGRLGPAPGKPNTFFTNSIILDVSIDAPRVCPLCVSETGYFRDVWQVAHTLDCDHHHQPLLETCPACDVPFTWSAEIMKGCPACGTPWSHLSGMQTPERTQPSAPTDASTIDTLYRAFLRVACPGAVQVWPRQTIEYIPGVHARLMQSAYDVVHDETTNQRLRRKAAGDLALFGMAGKSAARLVDDEIAGLLQPYKPGNTDPRSLPSEAFPTIALPKKVLKAGATAGSPAAMLSPETLAAVLGLDKGTIHALADHDCLPIAHPAPTSRDQLFNLEQIRPLFDTIATIGSEHSECAIPLESASKLGKLWALETWEIVAACLGGDLPCWLPRAVTTNPFEALLIDRQSLIGLGEQRFHNAPNRAMSAKAVADVLKITRPALRAIQASGELPIKRWSRSAEVFELETVRSFLARFRIARREAALNQTLVDDAWSEIVAERNAVLLERVDGGHLIGIAATESIPPEAGSEPVFKPSQTQR